MGIILFLILLTIGAISALSPETGWHMSIGWRFRDAEPSDAALVWQRIGGIVMIVIAFIILFNI